MLWGSVPMGCMTCKVPLRSLIVVNGWRLRKSDRTQLNILGPKAAELPRQDDNLILKAAALFPRHCQTDIRLHKTMPVASGIGGGSADAAATLHAMAALWDLPLPDVAAQVLSGR
jgi:4-diphosphocytidyl-2-C-methyl-D-erythritol kinase